MSKIKIKGLLIGRRIKPGKNILLFSDIVHIQKEFRPEGPAENAIIEITHLADKSFASYIPWVGYFDLDRQIKQEPTLWEIIEPGQNYHLDNVEWKPFE